MADINPLIQAANKSSAVNSAGTSQLKTNAALEQSIYEAMASAQQQIGTADQIITLQKDTAALAEQNARLKVGLDFGSDANAVTYVLDSLNQQASQAYAQKQQALKDIQEKQSVGFFDNPLEWLSNRFTINDDIRKFNTAEAAEDAAVKRAANINSLTASTVANQVAFQQTITQGTVAANQDKIAQAASVLAMKTRAEGIRSNSENVTRIMNASELEIRNQAQILAAKQSAEQLALSQRRLSMEEESHRLVMEKAKDEQEYADQLIAGYNRGIDVLGQDRPKLVPGSAQAKMMLRELGSKTDIGQDFQELYRAGATGVVSYNTAQVIDMAARNKVTFTPYQKESAEALNAIGKIVASDQMLNRKDPSAVSAAVKQATDTYLQGMLKNIKPGDSTNLFNIPDLKNLISNSPALQALPVVQKVILPSLAANSTLDHDSLIATLAKAMTDRTISAPEIQKATLIYQQAVMANIEARGLKKFGLLPTDPSKLASFNTMITTNPNKMFGSKELVNLYNEQDFMKAVTTRARSMTTGAGAVSLTGEPLF